jgi:hypothetical protein
MATLEVWYGRRKLCRPLATPRKPGAGGAVTEEKVRYNLFA